MYRNRDRSRRQELYTGFGTGLLSPAPVTGAGDRTSGADKFYTGAGMGAWDMSSVYLHMNWHKRNRQKTELV